MRSATGSGGADAGSAGAVGASATGGATGAIACAGAATARAPSAFGTGGPAPAGGPAADCVRATIRAARAVWSAGRARLARAREVGEDRTAGSAFSSRSSSPCRRPRDWKSSALNVCRRSPRAFAFRGADSAGAGFFPSAPGFGAASASLTGVASASISASTRSSCASTSCRFVSSRGTTAGAALSPADRTNIATIRCRSLSPSVLPAASRDASAASSRPSARSATARRVSSSAMSLMRGTKSGSFALARSAFSTPSVASTTPA